MVLVSAIVPVYNVEKLLSGCLESLLNQTHKEIEIICVNDGSKDQSADVLKTYQQKDSRIKVFTQENKGISAARNMGLKKARGEFIAFCDSDDYFHPQFVEKLLQVIEETNSDMACGCIVPTTMLYPVNFPDFKTVSSVYEVVNNPLETFLKTKKIATGVCRNLYRKSALKGLNFVEECSLCEDTAFMTELMMLVKKVVLTSYPVHYYYHNPNSVMHTSFSLKKVVSYSTIIRHIGSVVQEKRPEMFQLVRRNVLNKRFKMMVNHAIRKQKNIKERRLLFDAIQKEVKDLFHEGFISYDGLKPHHRLTLFLLLHLKTGTAARWVMTIF